MEEILEAYVTNLGKYNEGELIGEWVKFPVSKEEYQNVLERMRIFLMSTGCPGKQILRFRSRQRN